MTNLSRRIALVALPVLALGITAIVTGTPLRWTKGVVSGDACSSTEENYFCRVELVPDGNIVEAESESDIAKSRTVELRVFRNLVSGSDSYTIVR